MVIMRVHFWKDLYNNTKYRCYLSKRWNELTKPGRPLNYNSLVAFIDETTLLISEERIPNGVQAQIMIRILSA